jgi:hypothetical protein
MGVQDALGPGSGAALCGRVVHAAADRRLADLLGFAEADHAEVVLPPRERTLLWEEGGGAGWARVSWGSSLGEPPSKRSPS